MGTRKINPTSPGQRGMIKSDYSEITTSTPEKSLLKPIRKKAGRNNTGIITCRHKGGGHKQAYRIIDFKRDKFGVPGVVQSIEYDPNRNVRISLVVYADGEKRYILTPHDFKVGDKIVSGPDTTVSPTFKSCGVNIYLFSPSAYNTNEILTFLFGSYSTVLTTPGIPNLSRLKSITR